MLHSLTNMSLRVPVVLAAFVIFVPTLEASTGGRFSFASLAKGHQHDATRTEAWIETWPSSRTKTVAPLPLQDKKKQVGAISQRTLASSMSFLVGVADVFVFRTSTTTANLMTGNSIKCASAVAKLQLEQVRKVASMILCYALGSILYRTLVHYNHERPNACRSARVLASPLLVLCFGASDWIFYATKHGASRSVHLLPLASGFGLLAAAATDALGGINTFAYTGHINTISKGISDRFFSPDPQARKFPSASLLSMKLLGTFFLGLIVGSRISMTGSEQVTMPLTGFAMPAWLVSGQFQVPMFTILGVLFVVLMQLHDRNIYSFFRLRKGFF